MRQFALKNFDITNKKICLLMAALISTAFYPAFGQGSTSSGSASSSSASLNLGSDTGSQGRLNSPTNSQATQEFASPGITTDTQGETFSTGGQTANSYGGIGPTLPPTTTTQFGLAPLGVPTNYLPPTTLDSFVYNSGMNDAIYGDEGDVGPPPYNDFEEQNTIGAGMGTSGVLNTALNFITTGQLNLGGLSGISQGDLLTTGHVSPLPSAWLDTDTGDASIDNVLNDINTTTNVLNGLNAMGL
jgi:hypothetical protein